MIQVDYKAFNVGKRTLYWQHCRRHLSNSDLIIVEQASALLFNYFLLARQKAGRGHFALWGHGRNFRSHDRSIVGEWIKRFFSRQPHWWFAYNELSARIVRDLGFPPDRITAVQNTLDTKGLKSLKETALLESLVRLRSSLRLESEQVAIFCGSLYPEKRVGFLLEAAIHTRQSLPGFQLIIIGSGPESETVEGATREHDWIHYVGEQYQADKVMLFSLAKVMLLPGLVGLAIIDSFVLETPLITIDLPFHSPEIDYLEPGENGLLLPHNSTPAQYGAEVASLMQDEPRRQHLIRGCQRSAGVYSMEDMVRRFREGIKLALAP